MGVRHYLREGKAYFIQEWLFCAYEMDADRETGLLLNEMGDDLFRCARFPDQ